MVGPERSLLIKVPECVLVTTSENETAFFDWTKTSYALQSARISCFRPGSMSGNPNRNRPERFVLNALTNTR